MKSPCIIGHRGAAGHMPENTIVSFRKAFELGVHGIELDVHLSADGHVVVFHDETLNRMTNGLGAISNYTLADLKKLTIDKTHEMPTLAEVFNECPNEILINIEIKDARATQAVVHLISEQIKSGRSDSNILVSSFDWNMLKLVRAMNFDIQLGVLTEKNIDQAIDFAEKIQALSIHPNHQYLTAENTKRIKEHGFEIHTWTVNEYSDIDRIKILNVDAIITDFPDRI
jgi:glycerophosphoryl diester phosphodiesterase